MKTADGAPARADNGVKDRPVTSSRAPRRRTRVRPFKAEPKDLTALRNAFLHYGTTPNGVRPVVLESWRRCRQYGLQPDGSKPQQFNAERLAAARAANRELLAAGEPVLQRIHEALGSEAHIVDLTDRNGCVLRMFADPETARTAAGFVFEGASLAERDSGSNGAGTCLAIGKPVVLVGAEHFHTVYANWTCIGLPIRTPPGDIAGALNVAVCTAKVRLELWGWTHSLASEIEAKFAGGTHRPAPNPSSDADRAINALTGINELLLTQLDLPPTHARLIEEVGRAVVVTNAHRRQEEEKLRQSEERFRTLFTSISEGFVLKEAVFDVSGRVSDFRFVECNPAFCRLTGIQDPVGKTMRELFPEEESAWIDEFVPVVLTGKAVHFTKRGTAIDRWLDVFAWKLEGAAPPRIGTLITDVTARKRAEESLALAQEELRKHAANLERTVDERTARLRDMVTELEHFSYTVAHDLRAPLRTINQFSGILLEEYSHGLAPEARALVHRIERAGRRMHALTTDLLSYTRIPAATSGPLGPVSVEAALSDLLEMNPDLRAAADLIVRGHLQPVLGHHTLVQQILANLIDNAVKYAAKGVRPRVIIRSETVTLSPAPGPGSHHHLQVLYRANHEDKTASDAAATNGEAESRRVGRVGVRLWVEDNGLGIPPQFHEKIFGLFERLHPAADGGTGIGLAIVARACERMGGRCGVVSAPGEGSRFWVELAVAGETPPSSSREEPLVVTELGQGNVDPLPAAS